MAAEVQEEPQQETPTPPTKASGKKSAASPIKAGVAPIEKYLCWGALGVAGLMALVFLLDLFTSILFPETGTALDIFMILASGIVIYVAVDTLRELR